jgi:hypothetical protein
MRLFMRQIDDKISMNYRTTHVLYEEDSLELTQLMPRDDYEKAKQARDSG